MGRRSRQYSHCVPRRWAANQYPFADDKERGLVELWCGETRSWERGKAFESPRLATCLKCAQAIGKAKLGQLSARLRLEKRDVPLGYDRATYDLWIDGTLRAHVGIANGWGEKWYLAKATDGDTSYWTNGRHGGQVSGSVVDHFNALSWGEETKARAVFWPVHFAARDAMACAALAYWERHGVQGLPTHEESKALEAERKARDAQEAEAREVARAAARAEAERREAERLERMATARLGLEAWQAREGLSNVELAAIEALRALRLGQGGTTGHASPYALHISWRPSTEKCKYVNRILWLTE